MKRNNMLLMLTCGLFFTTSCMDLDLTPLSMATNDNWNTTAEQVEMSVNDLLRINVWNTIDEKWTDDECRRTEISTYLLGSMNSQDGTASTMWQNAYRVIGRDNAIIDKLKALPEGFMSEDKKNQYMGECLFVRACMYSRLITFFGDVPYSDTTIDIETGLTMGRTPKAEVLQKIYEARIALYNEDWDTAISCTQQIMDLGVYELYPSFRDLFLQSLHNTTESLFSIPRSITYNVNAINWADYLPRNSGGWAANGPTWDLLAAFLCTDGLPIDESPLFDPHNPFLNRDPRCAETIVPLGSTWLGIEYDPNPVTGDMVMNYNTGEEIQNKDNKNNAEYASFNGLIRKKGLDESCLENGFMGEQDLIILRYADVLLMYAEAKIEKGDIDQSVLDCMNQVRARAYGVNISDVGSYPAITTTDQAKLRTILRTERRMEFAFENIRFFDVLRWRLCGKIYNMKNYGLYQSKEANMENFTTPGHWFWAITPDIDENGCADFSALEAYGINTLGQRTWDDRQYLFPIPSTEVLINENMTQNPGY